jgi:hypothetical protein
LEPSCCLPVSLLALGGRLFPLTNNKTKKKRPANDKISPLFVDCVSTGDQSGQAGNLLKYAPSRDFFFRFEKRRVKVLLEHFSLFLILSVVYYAPTLF